jgi:hypothetical protein
VRAQLPVKRRAPHAQKDAELRQASVAGSRVERRSRLSTALAAADLRSNSPILYTVNASSRVCAEMLTWVPRATVGASAVARDRLDQVLERALIARLLALVQSRCHPL